jgi:hypothetical protein
MQVTQAVRGTVSQQIEYLQPFETTKKYKYFSFMYMPGDFEVHTADQTHLPPRQHRLYENVATWRPRYIAFSSVVVVTHVHLSPQLFEQSGYNVQTRSSCAYAYKNNPVVT